MYSVLTQEKTALRDRDGRLVYRRLYLCDTEGDVSSLPVTDAPGSGALVAAGGQMYLLDHAATWQAAGGMAAAAGGSLWKD